MLSDIGEFVKRLVELAKVAPPDALAVVLVGCLAVGGYSGYRWARARSTDDGRPSSPDPIVEHVSRLTAELKKDADVLWSFHKAVPPTVSLKAIHERQTKIVVFMNQKGGVAKTTTTVNLATYFAKRGKKVLVVDLDYQGSATATLVRASQLPFPKTRPLSDLLLRGNPKFMDASVGLSGPLSNIQLLPGDDSLNRTETRALLEWLLTVKPTNDARTAMVDAFATQHFSSHGFDIVLIDTPPRMTLGTINALVAATHFVVPTIPNNLAIGNVGVLLGQVHQLIKRDLNPQLELLGILATMTATRNISDDERSVMKQAQEQARDKWRHDAYIFDAFVPDRTGIAHPGGAALPRGEDERFFEAVGDELAKRLGVQ